MADIIRKELLTATETGRMIGVRRTAFAEFIKENPGFPKPVTVGKTKGGKVIKKWRRRQVEAFIDLLE